MTIQIPIPLVTLTRLGEVRPSDSRYTQPVPALSHLANQSVQVVTSFSSGII